MNENPLQGVVHHRRAHRPGRGGGARRVRPRSPSAAACSARWRPATSAAGSRTSRCSTSTASTTAPCRSSGSTPSSAREADDAPPTEVELARATEEEKQSQLDRVHAFQDAPRRRGAGRAAPGSRTAAVSRRERLRRAHGRGAGLLAAADHRGVLRGRRPVPPQRLTRKDSWPSQRSSAWVVDRADGLRYRRSLRQGGTGRARHRGRTRRGTPRPRPDRPVTGSRGGARQDRECRGVLLENITVDSDLDALAGRDLVVEAILEEEHAKVELFQRLDKILVAAANRIEHVVHSHHEAGVVTEQPHQVLGIHFSNPVPVLRLVELVPSLLASRRPQSAPACSSRAG